VLLRFFGHNHCAFRGYVSKQTKTFFPDPLLLNLSLTSGATLYRIHFCGKDQQKMVICSLFFAVTSEVKNNMILKIIVQLSHTVYATFLMIMNHVRKKTHN